jgi:glycerophosphoryl diester phosphodiesterase
VRRDGDRGRVLLLGHRGAVHPSAPENTLAAVERALRQNADGVEVDVRVTADGVAVLHHDASFRRTAGNPRLLSALAYPDLPWIGGHPVPRLSEVVDLVAGRGQLVVEVKAPRWPAGAAAATVEAVLAELRRPRAAHVTVSCFDPVALLVVRRSGGRLRTALLGRPGLALPSLLRRAVRDGHDEAHPHVDSLLGRLDLVGPALDRGLRVTGWTVDDPKALVRLADAEVHAVICDDPRAAREAVSASWAQAG